MTDIRPEARGLTLIEMSMSLIVLSVLLVACGSVLRLAAQATGTVATRNAAQLQAADAAARLADDLTVGAAFTARAANRVTFAVPDRLSAGTPQTVTYAWSGVSGDPLTRAFNGGAATMLLAGVRAFSLDYAVRTIASSASAESAVFDHSTTTGSANDFGLTNKNWASQQFLPSLPLGTSTYSVTRVRLYLKCNTVDSVLGVSVRQADALGKPTAVVLGQGSVYVSALSNSAYEWIDVPISGATAVPALQPVCVVVGWSSGGNNAAGWQYDQAVLAILSTANWSTSTNAGVSWGSPSLMACGKMAVYATVP